MTTKQHRDDEVLIKSDDEINDDDF